MATTTKKEVKMAFDRFAMIYNLKTSAEVIKNGTDFYSNDYIKLDFNSMYGGYRLDVVLKSTAERFFDGMSRKTGKEMVAYLNGLMAAKDERNFANITN